MFVYGELKNAQPEFFTNATLPSASATENRYRLIYNTDTKQLLVSDGTRWVQQGSTGGSKNYFQNSQINPDFEGNTVSPWSAFTTTLSSGVPTTVTTSATQMAISVSATNPLAGGYSMLLTKSAANAVGQGFISSAFTIDREDLAKVLTGSFYYEVVSGTINLSGTSTQSLEVWLYNVTANSWIQPSGYRGMNQGVGQGRLAFQFQTDATAANNQYRLVVLTAQTDTNAYVVKFDDFSVGPTVINQGAAMTDWDSFTQTGSWVSNTTYSSKWRRVGDTLQVMGQVALSGAPTSAFLSLNLPSGLSIDTTKVVNTASESNLLGVAKVLDNGSQYYRPASVVYNNATSVVIHAASTSTSQTADSLITQSVPMTFANGDQIWFFYSVPIAGWSSNVQLSSDTDTRVVLGCLDGSGTVSSINASTEYYLIFPAVSTTHDSDTHGAFSNTGTFSVTTTANNATKYTAPVSGKYIITPSVYWNSFGASNHFRNIRIYVNGSLAKNLRTTGLSEQLHSASISLNLNAGDVVSLGIFHTASASGAISSSVSTTDGTTEFNVVRVSGPSVIAANELIAARCAGGTPAGTVASSFASSTNITGMINVIDTHGSLVSNAFTASISGTYEVSAQMGINGTYSVNQFAALSISKNNTEYDSFRTIAAASVTSLHVQMPPTLIKLVAGDVVALRAVSNATTPTLNTTNPSFNIKRVGM